MQTGSSTKVHDVVIVGSGAAGGMAAWNLSRKGINVLVLDAGEKLIIPAAPPLAETKRKRVLIASSSEVYGKKEQIPFREDDDLVLGATSKARWSYACSKLMDEFLALAHAKEFGTPVVIARLFNTVGPRQTGRYGMALPRFIAAAKKNQPLRVFGDGRQTRCFCYVKDTVEALVRLYAQARWDYADNERRTGYSVVLFMPHGRCYRHPSPALQREVAAMPAVSSLQITFHENVDPARHAMPPGGFRVAIVNCWDRAAGEAARALLRSHFESEARSS